MQPDVQMMDEIIRRRAQLGASSSGVGAETTNSPTSGMPRELMTNAQPVPSGGAAGTPSSDAIGALKEQKGEATKLTDALVWRMKRLTEGKASQ